MSIVIRAENISKMYQLGQIGTGTLSRDIERFVAKMRGKEDPFLKIGQTNDRTQAGDSDIVWSLKDINFEVSEGDAVGIIGKNGAGKSTLLKILSRITSPTTGKIKIKGRVASLLEVGTGFHPELSGKENIYLNGAILGMRKAEIKRKFDEIVSFAGVERYIDTPVKRYSSGMYVRLAFAVAAHLDSEILIVDEVLAVGDFEFQSKCLGKMSEVSQKQGRTVLFVSHNMDAISVLCNKCMLLKNGMMIDQGPKDSIIKQYLERSDKGGSKGLVFIDGKEIKEYTDKMGNHDSFELLSVEMTDDKSVRRNTFYSDEIIQVKCKFNACDHYSDFRIVVFIKDRGTGHTIILSQLSDSECYNHVLAPGVYESVCRIPPNLLTTREYKIDFFFYHTNRFNISLADAFYINIKFRDAKYLNASFEDSALLRPYFDWSINHIE